jgi:hypothetical protein
MKNPNPKLLFLRADSEDMMKIKRSEKIIVICVIALLAQNFLGILHAEDAYRNAQGNLRRTTYGTGVTRETFAIMSQENSQRLVTGNGEQFVQIRYDETSHITSKAVWKVSKGVANRESLEEYIYAPGLTRPERRIKSDFVAKVQEETQFLRSGNPSRITVYALPDDAEDTAGKTLSSRTDFRYDTQDRVIEETRLTRTYVPKEKPPPAKTSPSTTTPASAGTDTKSTPATAAATDTEPAPATTAATDTEPAPEATVETAEKEPEYADTVETTRYAYTERSKPNAELYRDGVLVHKIEYTAERNYTETYFFEGGFSAVVTYENDEKKQERFFFNGEEIKRNI